MRSTIGMNIRLYTPTDLIDINTWYYKRKLPVVPENLLPKTGFIVPGIGAAFLYRTDGGIALCEGFITNPDTTREERIEARDLIMSELLHEAAHQGFKTAIAISNNFMVHDVCEKFGMRDIGNYKMFSKEL